MLGGAEKQAVKGTLGEKGVSIYQGLILWKYGLSSQGLQLSGICRAMTACERNIPGLPSMGKLSFFISFTAASCLWEIRGGNGIVWGYSSNKVEGKVLRARTLAVLAASTIQSCRCNSAFLPFFWCLLLPGAGFLSRQTVGGLVGANPECYTTDLVEFFWSVSHSWCGHFYFGCVKSAWEVSLSRGGWAARLVLAGGLTWPGAFPWCFPVHLMSLPRRVCTVFPSPSVSAGLHFTPRKLRLPLTLTAFGPVELFHVISGINEFLLLVVSPLSVG